MVLKTACLYYVLMEYVKGTTVRKRANMSPGWRLPEQLAAKWSWQLADAMEYLHQRCIVHRDIKCENLMVALPRDDLKLIDFSFSRVMEVPGRDAHAPGTLCDLKDWLQKWPGFSMSDTHCGTIPYASPELLQESSYDPFKSDCWAVGVCIYFMAFGCLPFDGKETRHVIRAIIETPVADLMPPPDQSVSEACRELIIDILVPVAIRPPLSYIKNHQWLISLYSSDWTPPAPAAPPSPMHVAAADGSGHHRNNADTAGTTGVASAGITGTEMMDVEDELKNGKDDARADSEKQKQQATSGSEWPNEQPAAQKKL